MKQRSSTSTIITNDQDTTSIELKKLECKGLIMRKKRLFVIKDMEKLKQESLLYFEEKPLQYTF